MSLKAFHIFFITASTLLALGFGVWAVRQYSLTGGSGDLVFAILGFAGAVGLPVYGVWFLKETRELSFL